MKWEYKIISPREFRILACNDSQAWLNWEGKHGWELVEFSPNGVTIFKREVEHTIESPFPRQGLI